MDAHFSGLKPGLYLILGGAGSGKSTLTKAIADRFGYQTHSVDDYFIGDSAYRTKLLKDKQGSGWQPMMDGLNQSSWWDWDRLWMDYLSWPVETKPVFLEGALLGPMALRSEVKTVFLYHQEAGERLKRILARDSHKRTTAELCARFLVTEYSERMYFDSIRNVIEKKGVKLAWWPSTGRVFIPMEVM